MSVARGFGLNGQALYSNIAKPCEVNLTYKVDSTNTNGLGVSSVKSNGYVNNVFMHTTQTPATSNGWLNPNPASGYALIQMKQNFNYFVGGFSGFVTSSTGSVKIDNGATLTVGNPYIITTLGNATTAQWRTVGVPVGITPAVGVSFIAIATGAGSGNTATSRVSTPVSSGIVAVEMVGNTNVMTSTSIGQYSGQILLVQFMASSLAGSALGTHTHDLIVIGGQAASTTNDVAVYSGPILGKEAASNSTILGANSATAGGVVAASAGTPAGTLSLVAAAPGDLSIVNMNIRFDASSVTIDGL